MRNFTENLQTRMFASLEGIGQSVTESGLDLHYFSQAVPVIKNTIMELKIFIYQYKFADRDEEILFYKEIAPSFVAEYIFHLRLKELASCLPRDPANRKKTIKAELREMNSFCTRHIGLYQYYRKGDTQMDPYYFTRKAYQLEIFADEANSVLDELFITAAGHRCAQFRAFERIIVLLHELAGSGKTPSGDIRNSRYKWTDNKLGLIEVVYALYFSGSINQGNVSIKELADFVGSMFNVRLDNIYRLKQQFLTRKNSSVFLDHLKTLFIKGLQDQDDRYLSR